MPRRWKPRLLPVLIGLSVVMIGFRVTDIVSRLVDGSGVQPIKSAHAESPTADPKAAGPVVAGTAQAAPGRHEIPDAGYSGAEVELLQTLAKRRAELDQRDADLQQHAAMLKVAEDRVNQKVTELAQLKGDIEKLLDLQKQQQDDQLNSLVKIYSDMKPPDAARIFDTLEMPVLVRVVSRMKEQKAAPVIAAMQSDRARELTTRLAALRQLPEAGRAALAAPTPMAPAPDAPAPLAAASPVSAPAAPPPAAASPAPAAPAPASPAPAAPPKPTAASAAIPAAATQAADQPAPASPKAPRSKHHAAPSQASAAGPAG
jgi:flagellar motility protein MotE (MotC chaperone)